MSTSLRAITALIVGGGPVARIIGKHLKLAGVDDIGLLLKPQYAPIADQGFELHQLITMKKKKLRQRYDDFKILTSVDRLAQVHYDQVYVCISGPELRSGWLEQAWPHLRHSLWISMTPGVDDREYMLRTIPERYVVMGKVGFIAYAAPLPGEDMEVPGIAYWFPPGSMTYFKGADEVATTLIARTLERGGMPAGTTSAFDSTRLYASAAATAFAAALEIHNWSFDALRRDRTGIARLCVTQGEIGNAIYSLYGRDGTVNRRLRRPFWWKMLLGYADGLVPFPLPEYMKHHFSKHRRQMEQQFGDFVKLVRSQGGEPTGTESLAREWARKRPAVAERSFEQFIPVGMVANTTQRSVYSETGQLGGEQRGKAAADARGMKLGHSDDLDQFAHVEEHADPRFAQTGRPPATGFGPPQPANPTRPTRIQPDTSRQAPSRQQSPTAQPYELDQTRPPHAIDDD